MKVYHEQKCPRCGETANIDGDHVEVEGDQAWQRIRCLECGHVYVEVYKYWRTEDWNDEEEE